MARPVIMALSPARGWEMQCAGRGRELEIMESTSNADQGQVLLVVHLSLVSLFLTYQATDTGPRIKMAFPNLLRSKV